MKRALIIFLSLLAVYTPMSTISAAQADDANVQANETADYADD